MVPDAPTLIVDLTVPESSLQKVFDACNNFPKNHAKVRASEMELSKFHKLLRDLDLFGPKLTTLDVDFMLLKARPRGAKKLSLKNFGVSIEMVAEKLGISASDIINKAIDLGCPLPSAPPRPEWKQLSPQLMAKTGHVRSDRLKSMESKWKRDEKGRSPARGGRSSPIGSMTASLTLNSPAEQRMLGMSAEWTDLRGQREALRQQYLEKVEEERRSHSAGRNRSTSLTASNGGVIERVGSEEKGRRGGGRTRSVTADTIPENEPVTPAQDKEPFVITDTQSGLSTALFHTPKSGRGEGGMELFSAFSLFCSMSPHKEVRALSPPVSFGAHQHAAFHLNRVREEGIGEKNEPKMSKTQPLMNMTEFRRLCRESDLSPSTGSEQPDILFHTVTKRLKTKYLDFDAFLYALERVALATHLDFPEMEKRITCAACALKEEGGL